jgi:FAD/FMN-containing dehydrogenase
MALDTTTISFDAGNELAAIIKGPVITPHDEQYDSVRKIWNGMIDRKPAVIVRCLNNVDIIQAVKFAREHNLSISVRGAGHNIGGHAVCDGGVMIDLSLMKRITVHPEELFAEVEMGATWGDFDQTTQQYGLATTGGLITTTGVAGLTLGGGVGWLVRKYGMSCDNLFEAEVITADGRIVNASLLENADLLWGLRGGGGNFGIVSSMKLRLHPVGKVLGGMIVYPREKAMEVIRFYRDFMMTAPEELTLYSALLTSPEGIPLVAILGCYCGDLKIGESVLQPLRAFGTPLADLMQPVPYTQMQSLLDASFPHGNRYYWKSGFLVDLSDHAIDVMINHMTLNPSPYSTTVIEYYAGAASREPEGGSAYPHRQPQFNLVINANWQMHEDDEENIAWIRKMWTAFEPFLSHKVYVNALGVEGENRVKEAYGDNYTRLATLKSKYDPDNVFRMNQNILPA